MTFQKATKKSARLRMALIGVAGAGKTYTALSIASHLGDKIAVLDTERGSASKYSDLFEFDVMEPETFSPKTYIDAIEAAESAGYDVIILDSLSHAWAGKDGALELVDRASRRAQSGNNFGAWRDVTPLHNAMVDTIIGAKIHIIATMRAKTEYVQEKDPKTGKTSVRKVGMAPVQRDGLEYEFDVVADIDSENNLVVGKTRCPAIAGAVFNKAGKDIALRLKNWLTDGGVAREAASKVVPKFEKKPAPVAVPVEEFEDDAIHCDCGVVAKYVRGKSGAGWICGHSGTGEAMCAFRMKEEVVEVGDDPFDDTPVGLGDNKVLLNGAHG
ncbi:MAG: ATP-binding protein [Armatimonadetes bacterium]|nr:ATP-binding protein [Armatimonadota bacterium]